MAVKPPAEFSHKELTNSLQDDTNMKLLEMVDETLWWRCRVQLLSKNVTVSKFKMFSLPKDTSGELNKHRTHKTLQCSISSWNSYSDKQNEVLHVEFTSHRSNQYVFCWSFLRLILLILLLYYSLLSLVIIFSFKRKMLRFVYKQIILLPLFIAPLDVIFQPPALPLLGRGPTCLLQCCTNRTFREEFLSWLHKLPGIE